MTVTIRSNSNNDNTPYVIHNLDKNKSNNFVMRLKKTLQKSTFRDMLCTIYTEKWCYNELEYMLFMVNDAYVRSVCFDIVRKS